MGHDNRLRCTGQGCDRVAVVRVLDRERPRKQKGRPAEGRLRCAPCARKIMEPVNDELFRDVECDPRAWDNQNPDER